MKTSILLCKIIDIEKNIEFSKINFYIKELIEYKLIEVCEDGKSLRLTEKGIIHANKNGDRISILLCNIFLNEKEIEVSKIKFYVKELIKKGFISINSDSTSLSLTQLGIDYVNKNV